MTDFDGQIAVFTVTIVLALLLAALLLIGAVFGYWIGRGDLNEVTRQRDSLQASIDAYQLKEWQK